MAMIQSISSLMGMTKLFISISNKRGSSLLIAANKTFCWTLSMLNTVFPLRLAMGSQMMNPRTKLRLFWLHVPLLKTSNLLKSTPATIMRLKMTPRAMPLALLCWKLQMRR